MVECTKCEGSGVCRRYMHIDNGRCFNCGGAGKVDATSKRTKARATKRPTSRFTVVTAHEYWESITGQELTDSTVSHYADTIESARAFVRSYNRPHAVGCRIEVREGETILATGTVNESGRIDWNR